MREGQHIVGSAFFRAAEKSLYKPSGSLITNIKKGEIIREVILSALFSKLYDKVAEKPAILVDYEIHSLTRVCRNNALVIHEMQICRC